MGCLCCPSSPANSPDWSHSRQVMVSLWPELTECTSQGCSVSRMWMVRLRSVGEEGMGQG